MLAETRRAAESVIDAFRGLNAHILVQEYIAEAKGCDIRCPVVGNEVVAAIERRAKEGISALTCTAAAWPRWRRLATRSGPLPSRQRKLSGWTPPVSIFYAARGPLVMEVNASPGWKGGNHHRRGCRRQDDRLDRAPGDAGILFENRRLTAGCKTAMVCGAFLRKLWRRFSTVRGHRHYGFTGRSGSGYATSLAGRNRHQLFECDSCQALHLPHMQNFDGILMPKLTRWTTWCSFPPRRR